MPPVKRKYFHWKFVLPVPKKYISNQNAYFKKTLTGMVSDQHVCQDGILVFSSE